MKILRIGLYTRFFLLFSATVILLVIALVFGIFSLSEQQAKTIVLERNQQLFAMMSSAATLPKSIAATVAGTPHNHCHIKINY